MPITSKGDIAKGDGTFIIDHVTVTDPKPDEVLVPLKAAGLCNWRK